MTFVFPALFDLLLSIVTNGKVFTICSSSARVVLLVTVVSIVVDGLASTDTNGMVSLVVDLVEEEIAFVVLSFDVVELPVVDVLLEVAGKLVFVVVALVVETVVVESLGLVVEVVPPLVPVVVAGVVLVVNTVVAEVVEVVGAVVVDFDEL